VNGVRRYEAIQRQNREHALEQLTRGGNDAANAIYSIALYDEDVSFAEVKCLEALRSTDAVLRFAAVGAIGEMAFVAGRQINFDLAERELAEVKNRYPELSGRIEDAIDDLAMAKKRNLESKGAE
jgi:hypothetical protein